MRQRDAVTGAFGFSGRYIAERLIENNHGVITLTNSVNRENQFQGQVQAYPFYFDKPAELKKQLWVGLRVVCSGDAIPDTINRLCYDLNDAVIGLYGEHYSPSRDDSNSSNIFEAIAVIDKEVLFQEHCNNVSGHF